MVVHKQHHEMMSFYYVSSSQTVRRRSLHDISMITHVMSKPSICCSSFGALGRLESRQCDGAERRLLTCTHQ